MNLPIELILAISVASREVTEYLFGELGSFFKGPLMRIFSLGVAIGLMFAAWFSGLSGLDGLEPGQVAAFGVFAGLGANIVHALLNKFAPTKPGGTLGGMLKDLATPNDKN